MDISTTGSTCTIIALMITATAVTTTPNTDLAVSYIATTTAAATDVTTIHAAARRTPPATTTTNTTITITTAFLHVLIFLLLI
jgi:hypothetical protein